MNLTKSETNNAIIVTLSNVRKHPNADRLKLATVLGTQVVVGLEAKDGDVVIYFDSNLRLSPVYLRLNDLYSNPELNSDASKKPGYFGKNGKVKAQKFRGEVSNGYIADMSSLIATGAVKTYDDLDFQIGDEFTHVNGVEICAKYVIPQHVPTFHGRKGKKVCPTSPMFKRHWDTKQLMRELSNIPDGMLWIEEKVHGTSGRTSHVLVDTGRKWWQFWKPRQEWQIISGTRRMDHILGHIPEVRRQIHEKLAPHLHKGETVYYEIFGHDITGKEIQQGFPYGTFGGEYKAMLYRVTITTPDNYSFDLCRDMVYRRADELGLVRPVVVEKLDYRHDKTDLSAVAEGHVHGNSAFANHMKEGVVIWFQNPDGTYNSVKHKSYEFLELESKQRDEEVGDVEDVL